MNKYLNTAGDTIVEVLISIAVLSVIIVGAYVSANHSTLVLRDTKEHTDALALAQNQVESLVSWYQNNNTGSTVPVSFGSYFCFDNSLHIITLPTSLSYCYIPGNNLSANPISSIPPVNNAPYFYQTQIQQISSPTFSSHFGPTICSYQFATFQVKVNWQSLLTGNNDEVSLFYRPSTNPSCR